MLLFPVLFLATQPYKVWREKFLLDDGWRFHLGNTIDPKKDFNYGTGDMYAKTGNASGPFSVGFNDSDWRKIDLPHDWAIELPFVKSDDEALIGHGAKPLGEDYPNSSIGWYRKKIEVPSYEDGRHLVLRFDGVFKDSTVFYNGVRLGEHLGGYEPFSYDVSALTHYGKPNEIVLRVNASQNSGWFYEGAGIYRHVWLICTNPIHIAPYGVEIVAKPSDTSAEVNVQTEANNSNFTAQSARIITLINSNEDGKTLAIASSAPFQISPIGSHLFNTHLSFQNPILWSLKNPHLYSLTTQVEVKQGDSWIPSDNKTDQFGVRTITFTPNDGFYLNGKRVEIKGACDHQDHAGVGIAVPDSLNYWRIEQLKKYGFNALRTSHNAPTRSVVEACDKLGVLVMDETRTFSTSSYALNDLASLVKRDRNSPSVIMWSIGNEEGLNPTPEGKRIAQMMMATIHKFDETRPITMASNQGNAFDGANSVLDLRGWNYIAVGDLDQYHKDHPYQPIFGSEEASTLSTRSEYENDPSSGFMSAYDVNHPGWGSTAEHWWKYYEPRKYLAGAFVWTGFDYRGEPTPYGWPCISSQFGVLDTCGFPKDVAYYYKAHWLDKPLVHIAPHWTWPGKEGKNILVWIETNCQEVKLYINGKLVGDQVAKPLSHLEFNVAYEPGQIEADGLNDGKIVTKDVEYTAGPMSQLKITSSQRTILADGESALVFNIEAQDSKGHFCPTANDPLHFNLTSIDSRIVGVGNGNPASHEPDTFVTYPSVLSIAGWQMANVSNDALPSGDVNSFGNLLFKPVDVSGDANQLPSTNTSAVFVSHLKCTAEQVALFDHLVIGQIDDHGTVFVNGRKIGETNDWNRSYVWPTRNLFHEGENTIVIWVNNEGGSGGLGQNVQLISKAPEPEFSRKLFNGLCQVIVRVGKVPGKIVLSAKSDSGVFAVSTVDAVADQHPTPRL